MFDLCPNDNSLDRISILRFIESLQAVIPCWTKWTALMRPDLLGFMSPRALFSLPLSVITEIVIAEERAANSCPFQSQEPSFLSVCDRRCHHCVQLYSHFTGSLTAQWHLAQSGCLSSPWLLPKLLTLFFFSCQWEDISIKNKWIIWSFN